MIVRVGNMYCESSKKVVWDAVETLGLCPLEIHQGSVVLAAGPGDAELEEFDALLRKRGMAVLTNPSDLLTDSVKMHAWNYVHQPDDPVVKFSVYLEQKLGYKYNYLSNVFSEKEGTSVTAFLNRQKILVVKSMISSGHSFGDIAQKLNYANLSHLSYVFKKATGETLTQYKRAITP